MPQPLTPEACNLHCEAQALIELATVQQPESSVSCMRNQSSVRGGDGAHDQEASVHTGAWQGNQQTKAGRLSGSGSSTRAARLKTTTLATS
jgi:hypothetical protein